jgi:hypothetical protein
MVLEGFKCEKNVKSVTDWVQDKEARQCPVCVLRPTAEYYIGILQTHGLDEPIKKLEAAWETQNVLTIAETMDKIKSEVGDNLKKDLVIVDCFAQSYEPAAD